MSLELPRRGKSETCIKEFLPITSLQDPIKIHLIYFAYVESCSVLTLDRSCIWGNPYHQKLSVLYAMIQRSNTATFSASCRSMMHLRIFVSEQFSKFHEQNSLSCHSNMNFIWKLSSPKRHDCFGPYDQVRERLIRIVSQYISIGIQTKISNQNGHFFESFRRNVLLA